MKKVKTEKDFDPFESEEEVSTNKIKIEEQKKKRKNNKKNKINIMPHDSIEVALLVVLIVMIIITATLGYKVYERKNSHVNVIKSSIVVPLLGKDTNNQISIDISNMKKDETKKYSFKVSNSKDNNINTEEVLYALQLELEDDAAIDIELYKNNGEKNILPENKLVIDNKLVANEEQTDTYLVKIKANKKTKDRDLITVNIIS